MTRSETGVVPTPVGVFLNDTYLYIHPIRRPHARGGVSWRVVTVVAVIRSSPRPWGCFSGSESGRHHSGVVPTPVGVFLHSTLLAPSLLRRPHARGGVSDTPRSITPFRTSSPRPWGCFSFASGQEAFTLVVPTPVGVFVSIRVSDVRRSALSSPCPLDNRLIPGRFHTVVLAFLVITASVFREVKKPFSILQVCFYGLFLDRTKQAGINLLN